MARFKGRVCAIKGLKVTIDRKAETKYNKEGEAIGSSWGKGDTPKINAVVRVNFHNRDKR